MINRFTSVLAVGVLALGAAACGSDDEDIPVDTGGELPLDPAADDVSSPAAGACLEGDADCFETGAEGVDEPISDLDEGAVIASAEALLGVPEDALPNDVRIGRKGEEFFALTEDYRIGRITVELDDLDGTFVVTTATIELTEGPLVIEL